MLFNFLLYKYVYLVRCQACIASSDLTKFRGTNSKKIPCSVNLGDAAFSSLVAKIQCCLTC